MAQLIWRSPDPERIHDSVQIAWEGKASDCLAAALDFFVHSAIESNQRLAQAEDPLLECLRNNAKANMEKVAKGEFTIDFTVVPHQDGSYSIWISEGPDRYDLID
jgi:hypothetical protein